jgi:large subunit ribosomal protein L13
MVTTQPIKDQIEKDWFLVDAENKILGRLASKIASILKGKTKPIFTPYLDTGDFVVVINAKKIKLTGRKLDDKVYYHYSGILVE